MYILALSYFHLYTNKENINDYTFPPSKKQGKSVYHDDCHISLTSHMVIVILFRGLSGIMYFICT